MRDMYTTWSTRAILSVLKRMMDAYASWNGALLGPIWALGLWFEFEIVPNIFSGSLLKVVFDRQE
jgi:hypothetical protein